MTESSFHEQLETVTGLTKKNRTLYNFFLKSIFLSSMNGSIKKKSKPRTKYCNKKKKKRPFFLPKINKVFLRPILQNLKGRSVLDKFFFENDPLDEPKQMRQSKKILSFKEVSQNRIYPSLTLLTAKLFPFKRVLKNIQSESRRFSLLV